MLFLGGMVAACAWNREGPIFPDAEEEAPVYEENNVRTERVIHQDQKQTGIFREVSYYDSVQPVAEEVKYVEVSTEPQMAPQAENITNFVPEIYSILASRMTNKILDDTSNIYEVRNAPSLYVMEPQKHNEDLPNGTFYAKKVTKEIIKGTKTFNIVSDAKQADYRLATDIDLLDENGIPVIQYKSTLFDKNDVAVKEWVETLKQVANDDKSWW